MFITLEGPDGVAKSTQVELLCDHLEAQGLSVYRTLEPTKDKIGVMIREILQGDTKYDPMSLLLLFLADRMEHIVTIREKLLQGKIVVCDRYLGSTIVYQYFLQRDELPHGIEGLFTALAPYWLTPTVTFLLQAPLPVILERLKARGTKREIFEDEKTIARTHDFYSMLGFYMRNSVFKGTHCLGQVWEINAAGTREETLQQMISMLRTQFRLPI